MRPWCRCARTSGPDRVPNARAASARCGASQDILQPSISCLLPSAMDSRVLDSLAQPPRSAQELLRPLSFPRAASFLGKLMAFGYRLTGRARYDDYRLEYVQGA